MSSGPDLYLVCKSCGAEVSPYITECPYCGTRIQKRAPKLDRGGVPKAAKARRSRPQLPRLRPGEIPGIRADRRAFVCWLLVHHPGGRSRSRSRPIRRGSSTSPTASGSRSPWRAFTAPFAYTATGYEAITLGAIALFGWLLERRHGWWATLFVFLITACGGAYVAVEFLNEGIARGANGGALGLLAAWSMRDVLGRRRGREDDSDLLGVLAIAAVLVLMPLAATEASGIAGIVGGVAGLLLGLAARAPARALSRYSALSVAAALALRGAAPGDAARQRGDGEHERDRQGERERTGQADDVGALARAHRAHDLAEQDAGRRGCRSRSRSPRRRRRRR